jgi:hypothetical protein
MKNFIRGLSTVTKRRLGYIEKAKVEERKIDPSSNSIKPIDDANEHSSNDEINDDDPEIQKLKDRARLAANSGSISPVELYDSNNVSRRGS